MVVVISWLILVLMIIYLFAIMPRITPRPMKEFRGWYYAHRGFHDNNIDVPENSKKAFALAVKNGYGIELDVQLTKDEKVVVFHDPLEQINEALETNLKMEGLKIAIVNK